MIMHRALCLLPAARRLLGAALVAFPVLALAVCERAAPRSAGPTRASSGEEARAAFDLVSRSSPAWRQRQRLLARLGADRWQAAGFRGQGVKVAILDTGFRGYRSFLGRVLPAQVQVRSCRTDGNLEARDSQHGILCGEVIHAIAPDAELLLANWDLDRPEEFLSAVRWAKGQGARIVSCSVVTPGWSDGDGDGEIHQALARVLGSGSDPHDLLCFASAGNTTERHWGGVYQPGPDGFHHWLPGRPANGIMPWGKEPVSVELYWHPGADYDLFVVDDTTGRLAAQAHTDHHHGGWSSAVTHFRPRPDHYYHIRVRLTRGRPGPFHLTVMESTLEMTTARASVCFPGDGPEVVAMGAVDAAKHRVSYSACGPNSNCPKPDFVATIPFPSLWRQRPFAGTSAAAPQGAAVAALWLCRHPDWTPTQVRQALRSSAEDLNSPGPDPETGYGLIRLP